MCAVIKFRVESLELKDFEMTDYQLIGPFFLVNILQTFYKA